MKEGKIGRKDGQPLPGEDEPLHAYVTANNPENVTKAVAKVYMTFRLTSHRYNLSFNRSQVNVYRKFVFNRAHSFCVSNIL